METSTYIIPGRGTTRSSTDIGDILLFEHRRRFAKAIAKPSGNALLIDRDNRKAGWCTLDEALAGNRAFAVEVAKDIFAADNDRPELVGAVHDLADSVSQGGYHPVLIASGRPGHLHLLARIADEHDREHLVVRARAIGLDVRHCIRPPFAPHRLGLPSGLIRPSDPEEALRALATARQLVDPLSPAMQRLLRHGDDVGRYLSRSEVVQAVVQGAVNADWPFERLFWELCNPSNRAGEKVQGLLRERGDAAARRYVLRSWKTALAMPPARLVLAQQSKARQLIAMIAAGVDAHPWPGKAGATDRAVVAVHLATAHARGSLTYGASVRDVADRSGVTAPTVVASHRRLRARGWLRLLTVGRGTDASTWRLLSGPGRNLNTLPHLGGCEDE